jgi:hypothetical protein
MIHGRKQENKDAAELEQEWISALRNGYEKAGLEFPEDVIFDFPYYGDLLISLQGDYENENNGGAYILKSSSPSDDPIEVLQEKILEEMLSSIDLKALNITEEQPETNEKGWYNHAPFLAVARKLDSIRFLGNFSLVKATSDVAAYLSVKLIRHKVNQAVNAAISADTDVVIGHSLGSVIAYDVLCSLNQDAPELKLFITLGSPLGMKRIKAQLATPLKRPSCLNGEWINLYDRLDLVSLNPLDNENFAVNPAIENFQVQNNSSEHHDISEYLSDPLVASYINKVYLEQTNSTAS